MSPSSPSRARAHLSTCTLTHTRATTNLSAHRRSERHACPGSHRCCWRARHRQRAQSAPRSRLLGHENARSARSRAHRRNRRRRRFRPPGGRRCRCSPKMPGRLPERLVCLWGGEGDSNSRPAAAPWPAAAGSARTERATGRRAARSGAACRCRCAASTRRSRSA